MTHNISNELTMFDNCKQLNKNEYLHKFYNMLNDEYDIKLSHNSQKIYNTFYKYEKLNYNDWLSKLTIGIDNIYYNILYNELSIQNKTDFIIILSLLFAIEYKEYTILIKKMKDVVPKIVSLINIYKNDSIASGLLTIYEDMPEKYCEAYMEISVNSNDYLRNILYNGDMLSCVDSFLNKNNIIKDESMNIARNFARLNIKDVDCYKYMLDTIINVVKEYEYDKESYLISNLYIIVGIFDQYSKPYSRNYMIKIIDNKYLLYINNVYNDLQDILNKELLLKIKDEIFYEILPNLPK